SEARRLTRAHHAGFPEGPRQRTQVAVPAGRMAADSSYSRESRLRCARWPPWLPAPLESLPATIPPFAVRLRSEKPAANRPAPGARFPATRRVALRRVHACAERAAQSGLR